LPQPPPACSANARPLPWQVASARAATNPLRLARHRISKRAGKCEGRKSHAEERPEAIVLARQLHKQGMGYRAISGELAKAGHVNERGKHFHHKSVRAMLKG
jgi:hypothetical protein